MKAAIALTVLLSTFFTCPAIPQQAATKTWNKTYSLLPGRTLNLKNKAFHRVEIRSEYPVQIAAGECHTDYTVQWTCSFKDPSDLFIRDLRSTPVFSTPRANAITVSAKEN
jgi:hypothetical protein